MNQAAKLLFKSISVHRFAAFRSWMILNKPGDQDIYRPDYDCFWHLLEFVRHVVYPELEA